MLFPPLHVDKTLDDIFFHRFNAICYWLSFYLHFFIFFAEFSPNIDANLVENVVWSSMLVTVWMTYSLWLQQFINSPKSYKGKNTEVKFPN